MFNKEDYGHKPNMLEISEYVNNSLWDDFIEYINEKYQVEPIFEFSKCSWEYGWNVKFKKSGKSLCTLYPKENYFTVLIVIGKNEKIKMEDLFATLNPYMQQLYLETEEGNNQKWLMIDLEDFDSRYEDTKKILNLRIK